MFVHNINQAIEKISQSNFINDKIELELNTNACKFLFNQGGFDIDMKGDNKLILYKHLLNSIGNSVSPSFIAQLKKTIAFALNYLALNYIEINKNNYRFNLHNNYNNDDVRASICCNATSLKSFWQLTEVSIGLSWGSVWIEGESNELLKFINIIRIEAIRAHTSPSIALIMCARNDQSWLERHQLLKEIFETIVLLNYSLITLYPVDQPMCIKRAVY